jgi:hypothetical protein
MFFNCRANQVQINNIKCDLYSPAHITSVFLRYRNEPENALIHLDDIEHKIQITPLFSAKNNKSD